LTTVGNKCTVAVQTDAQSYTSESIISGRVYVSVTESNGVPARCLNICFRGEENVVIHYTTDDTDHNSRGNKHHRQTDHFERDTSSILHLDAPIHTTVNGRLPLGQYEFPFQLAVPHSSPSSVRFYNGQSKCQIHYYMQAYLSADGRANENTTFSNPFKVNSIKSAKTYLRIIGTQNPENFANGPIDIPEETQIVYKCCCKNKGSMTLKSDLDNDVLIPNQTYNLNYCVRNDSTVPIQGVKIVLEEHIEFRSHYRNEQSKIKIVNLYEDGNVFRNIDGLSRASLLTDTRQVQIFIPPTARTSHSGRLIEIYHRLLIIVKTECCMSNPESCINVSITGQQIDQIPGSATPQLEPSATLNPKYNAPSRPPPSAPYLNDEDDEVVEAIALPDDWFPVTADIAHLPVARVVLEERAT